MKGFHGAANSSDHSIAYSKLPVCPADTFTRRIALPSAMRASTVSEISGSKVPLRIWSTLRAPLSTSLQRCATASMREVVVDKLGAMILFDTPFDLAQLEIDDPFHDLVTDRVIRHHGQAAEKRGLENALQLGAQHFGQCRRIGNRIRTQALLHD